MSFFDRFRSKPRATNVVDSYASAADSKKSTKAIDRIVARVAADEQRITTTILEATQAAFVAAGGILAHIDIRICHVIPIPSAPETLFIVLITAKKSGVYATQERITKAMERHLDDHLEDGFMAAHLAIYFRLAQGVAFPRPPHVPPTTAVPPVSAIDSGLPISAQPPAQLPVNVVRPIASTALADLGRVVDLHEQDADSRFQLDLIVLPGLTSGDDGFDAIDPTARR